MLAGHDSYRFSGVVGRMEPDASGPHTFCASVCRLTLDGSDIIETQVGYDGGHRYASPRDPGSTNAVSSELALYITRYGYLAIFLLVFLQELGVPNPVTNEAA